MQAVAEKMVNNFKRYYFAAPCIARVSICLEHRRLACGSSLYQRTVSIYSRHSSLTRSDCHTYVSGSPPKKNLESKLGASPPLLNSSYPYFLFQALSSSFEVFVKGIDYPVINKENFWSTLLTKHHLSYFFCKNREVLVILFIVRWKIEVWSTPLTKFPLLFLTKRKLRPPGIEATDLRHGRRRPIVRLRSYHAPSFVWSRLRAQNTVSSHRQYESNRCVI